jgi:hypothetical protein
MVQLEVNKLEQKSIFKGKEEAKTRMIEIIKRVYCIF